MRGERSVRLLLPPGEPAATRGGGQTASRERSFLVRRKGRNAPAAGGRGAAAPDESLDAEARTRFEALRAHRLEMAQTEGVPPYVVASDRSLRDLARLQPRSEHELTLAHGIGEAKARKYGAGFLEVLRRVEQALAES
jgi:ATP-dependent DNA helicase RecQ